MKIWGRKIKSQGHSETGKALWVACSHLSPKYINMF